MAIRIHNGKEIEAMRRSGRLAGELLCLIGEHVRPGVTTGQLNDLAHDFQIKRHAIPAPLGYGGGPHRPPFPKSICTSVNETVCHGIPSDRVLVDGDIVNVDVTPILPKKNGWHGDTSVTFYVGEPSQAAKHVVEVARQCLEIGLQQIKPGAYTNDIGRAIQAFAQANGCSVVRDYTGHGVGQTFHAEPTIVHYDLGRNGVKLKKGMIFTVEPMINLGGWEVTHGDDGWTVLTKDGALSAQFEHSVVVTKKGVEVLTQRPGVVKGCEDVPWAKLGTLSSFPHG